MSDWTQRRQDQINILYFGVTELDYPRNHRIRTFLTNDLGATVIPVLRPRRSGGIAGQLAMLRSAVPHVFRRYDVIVLAEFSLSSFWVTWLLSKTNHAVHMVDFFIGTYETRVEDRREVTPSSLKARLFRIIDVLALRSSDIAVTDTAPRARLFQKMAKGTAIGVLPVGAPDWAAPAAVPRNAELNILYYGNYIQLHGVDFLTEALMQAARYRRFTVTMIGDGSERPHNEQRVRESAIVDRFTFLDSVSSSELADHMARADVVIGVFGESSKAETVIANKVWQGLYANRTVITRFSAALLDISEIAGSQLIQVAPGSPSDIAKALRNVQIGLAHRPVREELEKYVRSQFSVTFAMPQFRGLFTNKLDQIVK